MDNDDDVIIEDWYLFTDPAKKVLDDVEVCYRVWANGYPLKPNHCVRLIYDKKARARIEEEVSSEIMHQVWDNIEPAKKEEAAALRRVAA
jgi:hypothetical protein